MAKDAFRVLFLCTGNSARSIMAEVLLNELGGGRFRALSAGAHRVGPIHPMTLTVLEEAGHATDGLESKGWEGFARAGAFKLDLVIIVCDSAAEKVCPAWPARPATVHWSVGDPAAFVGSESDRLAVFERVYRAIRRRVEGLVAATDDELAALARKAVNGNSQGPGRMGR